ncbi:hypothetical protein EW146_g4161 [Bondarzewia mesenterica]|uniref:Mitochondrial outer membrane protein IML2 n=1 Tax=Bondarzewia mesenterica TaxID=1095465 RepID=A0A4S4LVI6_9AGAM|nr:hypothetical protein EW146_g4161 [Bondarzewia mesenterica]
MSSPSEETMANLRSATSGFDYVFSNEIDQAREVFQTKDDPFHQLGLGVCAFLEAALGMESGLMVEATRLLALAEVGAKKQAKATKSSKNGGRFPQGTEWELIHADAIILLGLTNALSESYMGYLQCLYSLHNAHSKFARLYKIVFPVGVDDYATPATSRAPSRKPSNLSLKSHATSIASANSFSAASTALSISTKSTGFFGRWGTSLTISRASSGASTPVTPTTPLPEDGPVEELIVSGAAFGYGLFNLVLSLLPGKVKSVVGFFGFNHDRKLALQALAVSAAKNDVHAVFAGLSLMSYHGVVLLLSGYQANEAHIIKQYKVIVEKLESRYPTGTLWILNRAKILRMAYDADGAIRVLQDGLQPERTSVFVQADALLVFELAWTLLSQRRYQEAAETFMRMTELNTWSHATYYFIAAGCYWSLKNYAEAQNLMDAIPSLIDKKKIGGKDLPTEVLIKKRLAFYKAKQIRSTGSDADYIQAIRISPAEELGIFWNTHARIGKNIAEAHIHEWLALTPAVQIDSPYSTALPPSSPKPDLDNADELALRSLLLGIVHRTTGDYTTSRAFLTDAYKLQPQVTVSTWIGGIAQFELAVLELKEATVLEDESAASMTEEEREDGYSETDSLPRGVVTEEAKEYWVKAIKEAGKRLDAAMSLAGSEIDLSTRLDSRVMMLRDEIATKKEMLGL